MECGNINSRVRHQSTQLSTVIILRGLDSGRLYLNAGNDREILPEGILECIDEGLVVFGASVKNVIYWGLEHEYGMKRMDVLTRPEIFCSFLKEIFGAGSKIVEGWIVKKLASKFGIADFRDEELLKAITMTMSIYRQSERAKKSRQQSS